MPEMNIQTFFSDHLIINDKNIRLEEISLKGILQRLCKIIANSEADPKTTVKDVALRVHRRTNLNPNS